MSGLFVCTCGYQANSQQELLQHIMAGCARISIPQECLIETTEAEDLIACTRCKSYYMPEFVPCRMLGGVCPYKMKPKE